MTENNCRTGTVTNDQSAIFIACAHRLDEVGSQYLAEELRSVQCDLLAASPVEQPAAAPIDDARKCLMDVVSHHDSIVAGFAAQRLAAEEAQDSDTAGYWKREIDVAHRMKAQAERALAAASPAAEAVALTDEGIIQLFEEKADVDLEVYHGIAASTVLSFARGLLDAPQPAQADALGEEAYVAKRMTETLATVYATIIGDDEVDTDDGLNAIERVVRAAQVLRLEVDLYRAQADAPDDTHKFKNFHRRLCERFGYVHDEIDWRRDQVSLIEWIAKKADAPAEAREPIAWMTDDDRAITAAQKQRALADGGATASSVRPYSIPCYAVSAPADAGEARLTDAARDMLAERRRQVEAEGWTPEHDDQYQHGAIALAAACYAANAGGVAWADPLPSFWPWMHNWWKPTTPRRDLVKAGALILAELERLDRAALLNGADHDQ
ncbi:hypothetical protein [Burkholderia pseudomallei]|uniref:hypothetical protein n=1 Tax=Burkholderia pseudomallei TaxID=28450 RepID=UPI000AEA87A7